MRSLEIKNRTKSIAAASIAFSAIKSITSGKDFGAYISTVFGLPSDSVAGIGFQVAINGSLLVFMALAIESALTWWATRELLGEWVYKSSSGTFGHVVFSFSPMTARLRYRVDLYENGQKLLGALNSNDGSAEFATGEDQNVIHNSKETTIFYEVLESSKPGKYYPGREGILKLRQTNKPKHYSANWYRLGSTYSSNDKAERTPTPAVDDSPASGTFEYFIPANQFKRNEGFLAQAKI